ncbi:hypothetical protein O6H91_09G102200 [Diphasiastrum complanatum]|uniref:Uncharacterized protein n=14 Tax=Diphasiastrum complanatum TaxID=34168 RepID=A0ACC2BQT3_DIPCM|nr:hypothetical protein O6H91_14G073600 [Diphasiastrum complanatum]KAJ7532128.1 hypothetical protein O6H91_14G073600 [Diphasiastrum complanatum]KAJ7532130.1 hypothetical protein O6H91_14G073600 [Diphasiastrum complanatum]KAJ7532133.1 hypothetical protein O6H91_14G073600 [Diphasiastrum complanatum]KAJ7532134.1 hypothetical protein O6H91_14G073600 [Diphasiastrum complanatum]
MAAGTHLSWSDEWISFCQTQLTSDPPCSSKPLDRKPLQPHTFAPANSSFSVASSFVGDTYFTGDQAATKSSVTENCKPALSILPWKASSTGTDPRFLASDEIKNNLVFGHSAQTSSSQQECFPGSLIQNLENSNDCTSMSTAMNPSLAYVEGMENLAVAERATIGELIERLRNNLHSSALSVSHPMCLTSLGMDETPNISTGFCSLEASDYMGSAVDASRRTFPIQELPVPDSQRLKPSTSVNALAEPFSRSHACKIEDVSYVESQISLNKGDIHSGILLPNDTNRISGYASTHKHAQGALSDYTPVYTSPEETESNTRGGPADSSNSKPLVSLEASVSVHPVDDSILKKQKVLHEVNLPNILQEASTFKRQDLKTLQTSAIGEPLVKKTRVTDSRVSEARTKAQRRKSENLQNAVIESMKGTSKTHEPPKQDYIHVRARRGQATDSHSLAERARREKISERMKFLQDLVPGCNKITGKALMLDEIINYVQSLQYQVEFLSMKLAAFTSRRDPNLDIVAMKQFSEALVYPSDAPQHANQKAQLHRIYRHVFQDLRSPSYVPQSNLGRECNLLGHGCQYPDAFTEINHRLDINFEL